jgi:anti-sigma factor RsiW
MDHNTELKLQAWLDGELPEAEARQVTQWLAQDREAASLADELRNTRQALAGSEPEVRLPESHEFYWSKIEREIQRLETPARPAAAHGFGVWFRRFLVPAAAVAALVVAAVALLRPAAPFSSTVETALADPGAMTYRDDAAGTTLVWLSYPAENEVADNRDMDIVP